MATTTNYSFNKPTVGGSANSWGTDLNANWDSIDSTLHNALTGASAITPNLTAGSWKVGGTAITSTAAEINKLNGVTATTDEINLLAGQALLPPGSITMHAGASAPSGWLPCDGAAVSRSTYAALYAIVGTAFGAGDGSLTFNLPDLRDRFPVGTGTTYSRADTGGAATHTLTTAEMPAHTHTATSTVTDPGHDHYGLFYSYGEAGNDGGATTGNDSASNSNNSQNLGTTTDTTGITVATTIASTGGGFPHNNLPPYIGLAFIIKT